jgi:hypothetical protein
MLDQLNPGILDVANGGRRLVVASIINGADVVYPRGDPGQSLANEFGFSVTGNDDGDTLAEQHGPPPSGIVAVTQVQALAPWYVRAVSRRWLILLVVALVLLPLAYAGWSWLRFPSDKTPEGAYLRVVTAVNRGKPELAFAYTETQAQHAAYTIRDARKRAKAMVIADFPPAEQAASLAPFAAFADAPDGADIFAIYARQRGWLDRLRRDLSGIVKVETQGDRATIVTVKGTRYAFRRRDNGIWGMTLFTAALAAEAERASRDLALIEQSAADYRRAKAKTGP